MTEKKLFMTGLGLFGLLVLLLWGGLLPTFAFVLAIVAITGLIVITHSNIEAGFWRSASITAIVLLLFFLNIWPLITGIFSGIFPLSTQAVKDRKEIADLQGYEILHAPAGIALGDYRKYCDSVEAKITDLLKRESIGLAAENNIEAMLRRRIDPNTQMFTPSSAEEEYRAKIIALKKERAQCSKFILENTPKGPIIAARDYVRSLEIGIVGWIAILVFLNLMGVTIAWGVQKMWVSKLTFAVVMTLVIYLIGSWISSTGFSLKDTIHTLAKKIAPAVGDLSHDIVIALIVAAIIGAVASAAAVINGIQGSAVPASTTAVSGGRKGSKFPTWAVAGFALSTFVLYQLVFFK